MNEFDVYFAIESSIAYLEKEQNQSESIKISKEGIQRAENKLKDLTKLHRSFIE